MKSSEHHQSKIEAKVMQDRPYICRPGLWSTGSWTGNVWLVKNEISSKLLLRVVSQLTPEALLCANEWWTTSDHLEYKLFPLHIACPHRRVKVCVASIAKVLPVSRKRTHKPLETDSWLGPDAQTSIAVYKTHSLLLFWTHHVIVGWDPLWFFIALKYLNMYYLPSAPLILIIVLIIIYNALNIHFCFHIKYVVDMFCYFRFNYSIFSVLIYREMLFMLSFLLLFLYEISNMAQLFLKCWNKFGILKKVNSIKLATFLL